MNKLESRKIRYKRINDYMKRAGIDTALFANITTLKYVGDLYQNLAWYVNTVIIYPQSEEPTLVCPLSDRSRVVTDCWIKNIEPWNPEFLSIEERSFEKVVDEVIRKSGVEHGVLGIESSLNWKLVEHLKATFPNMKLVEIDKVIQEVMVFKDEYEIDMMRKVASICDAGYLKAKEIIRPGITENELAGHIELEMRIHGCEGYWVPNQVGTGKVVLMDHYPSETVIGKNDYVKIGLHPVYNNYCGDICAIYSLAKPDEKFHNMCNAVEIASGKVIEAMKPGVKSSELFMVYYNYLEGKGYHQTCNWYIGHGLGTGHLKPLISPNDDTVLEENMIIILNALAQPRGENGFMNEIMLLINADGAEKLSTNPLGLTLL